MASNYPDRQSTTDDSDKIREPSTTTPQDRHNYPEKGEDPNHYCWADGGHFCKCGHIEDLKKRIEELESQVAKFRKYMGSKVQIDDPDNADYFDG